VSAIMFGLAMGCAFVLDGTGLDRSQPITPSLVAMIVGYGIFHWTLLSAVTLPIFVSPVILWLLIARAVPSLETRRGTMLLGVSCVAVLGVALRFAFLEYPGLLRMPGATVAAFAAAPSSQAELLATWVGLLAPRLCLSRLATGAFASAA
jgi:hypothetical protein